jgi:hypothetical protein
MRQYELFAYVCQNSHQLLDARLAQGMQRRRRFIGARVTPAHDHCVRYGWGEPVRQPPMMAAVHAPDVLCSVFKR